MTSSMLRPERRADEICTWRERDIRPAILFLARALCERPCVYMWVVTWFRQVKDKDGETVAFFQELSAQAAAAERGEEGDEKAEEDTTFSDPADDDPCYNDPCVEALDECSPQRRLDSPARNRNTRNDHSGTAIKGGTESLGTVKSPDRSVTWECSVEGADKEIGVGARGRAGRRKEKASCEPLPWYEYVQAYGRVLPCALWASLRVCESMTCVLLWRQQESNMTTAARLRVS